MVTFIAQALGFGRSFRFVPLGFSRRGSMLRALRRLLAFFGIWLGYRPPDADPYARRLIPRKPQPKTRSGAVAVMEPDE
jgi:hypothetical protein